MKDTFKLFKWGQRLSMVLTLLALSFVLFFMAAGATRWSLGATQKAAQPKLTHMAMQLRAITRQPKVICFTRFMIDFPRESDLAYGRLTAGGELTRIPDGAEKINEIILEKIKKNRENFEIFSESKIVDFETEKIISRDEEVTKHLVNVVGHSKYTIHSFFKLNSDAYFIRETGVPESYVKDFLSDNTKVALHLRARSEDEIPKVPGICIDGAFSTLETPYEGIELGARLRKYSDIHFSLKTIKNADYLQKVELANNMAEAKTDGAAKGLSSWINRVKVLRQNRRVINNWNGEELLLRIPSGFGKPSVHKFIFRASGEKNDPLHPFVELTLDTGVKGNRSGSVEPSLSDDEALALWDWLLNSIRVRPNAVAAKASTPAIPGA